jgi:hypothetical protein
MTIADICPFIVSSTPVNPHVCLSILYEPIPVPPTYIDPI